MGLLVLLVLVAVACGGKSATDEPTRSPGVRSPLAELLGYSTDPADQAAEQQRFIEQERKVQQAVADCMKQEGFEYIAQDPAVFMGSSTFDEDIAFDSKEWAEKYGFGMSTTFGSDGFAGPGTTPPTDPNQAYVESLSEAERAAYHKALYGEVPAFDPTSASTTAMAAFEPSGCDGEARRATDTSQAFYSEFGDEMQGDLRGHPELSSHRRRPREVDVLHGRGGLRVRHARPDVPRGGREDGGVLRHGRARRLRRHGARRRSGGERTRRCDRHHVARASAHRRGEARRGPGLGEEGGGGQLERSRDLNRVQQEVSAEREQEFIDANRARIDELLAEQN